MKQLIWIVVILALVVGGIFLFRKSSVSDESTNSTDTTSNSTASSDTNLPGMKSTLGGIFDDPGSYQCDYEQVTQNTRATNVVYIADGKLRGEFRSTVSNVTTLSMAVYDGSKLYVWTEGQPTGKVTQPKTIKDLPSAIPEDITSGRILGTSSNNVSWNCHAWSKDATKLVKPSYVVFN